METEDRDERLIDTTQDEEQPQQPARRQGGGRKPRAASAGHDDRLAAERDGQERGFSEDREFSDAERLEMFRDSRFQSVLPDLPTFPGFHVCWLTTTNPRDSLQNRLRQGYQLITISECAKWDGAGQKVGIVDNVISVNEMVAAKLPLRLYNLYMREAHHNAPLEEEQKLVRATENMQAQAEEIGAVLQAGDGLEALKQRAPRHGNFTE